LPNIHLKVSNYGAKTLIQSEEINLDMELTAKREDSIPICHQCRLGCLTAAKSCIDLVP